MIYVLLISFIFSFAAADKQVRPTRPSSTEKKSEKNIYIYIFLLELENGL